MSTSTLTNILSQLHNNSLSNPQEISSLLTKAKRQLLTLNALLPTPSTPPHIISLARQTLETGALLSIRAQDPDAFTRYYQQLLPFYELPESNFEHGTGSGQRSKVTGLYLLLLLTKGDYAGFHTVLEGLEIEEAGKGGLDRDEFIQYPVKLERWLMEGSYDRVWGATKREGAPSEEYGVFSEVLVGTIRSEIASCSEKAYPSLPIANAKNLLFLESEGAVVDFAQVRGWVVKDGRIYFPIQQGDEMRSEKDILVASGQVIENTIGYARELETIVLTLGQIPVHQKHHIRKLTTIPLFSTLVLAPSSRLQRQGVTGDTYRGTGMALQAEEGIVDGDGGYISDDSSFYGDDDLRTSLTEKANNFDPSTYWPNHHLRLPTIAAIARTKASTKPPKTRKSTKPYNPYEGQLSGRQLTETVTDFLSRLPPSKTPTTEISDHWIRIANPLTPKRPTSEDWARFTETANEHLDAYNAARAKIEASMSGKAKSTIACKLTPMRKQLETDILAAAQKTGCTTGKWLLFVAIEDVDFVWGKVARGTVEEELGVAAKVAAKGPDGEGGKERLVCVYTADFEDRRDVGRVLRGLKEKGLLRGGNGDERVIYYKCDALTHLGINAGNEYGIKASLFSSKDILAMKEVT